MKTISEQLIEWILAKKRELLVFIFGPAGIGKTALCHYIIGVVIEALKDMLMKDREWIPISYNGLDDKWERAIGKLGARAEQLSGEAGHA